MSANKDDTWSPGKAKEKISDEKIIAAYEYFGSLRRSAQALNRSHEYVRDRLKKIDYDFKPAQRFEKGKLNEKTIRGGRFSQWVKDQETHHQEFKLPRSVKKLSELSGASPDAVKSYLYSRRRSVKEFLKSLPDLRKQSAKLLADNMKIYDVENIKSYSYHIDRYSLEVHIDAILIDGLHVTFHIPDLESFINQTASQSYSRE